MSVITLTCEYCGAKIVRRLAWWLRSGPHAYCDRTCSGLGRRKHKSKKAKRAAKAAYDVLYRAKNLQRITERKKEYFHRTYDPEKARIERKKNMPRHVAYCRRPEYRKKKHAYDVIYNAKRQFGDYAESFRLLQQIETEVGKRMSDYEIRLSQGRLNKMQTRKKALTKNHQ